MPSEIQKKRFMNLIKTTELADARAFTMEKWAHRCGSPACVLGNYAANKQVQRSFYLVAAESGGGIYCKATSKTIDYLDYQVHEHFGITSDESIELFDSDGCGNARTRNDALKYLKKFFKRKYK